MKVLVVGSGGREHALAWAISASPLVSQTYVAPGNGGTPQVAINLEIKADDIDGLVDFSQEQGIGLVVVGPEQPLVLGLVDRLRALKIPVFGPTQAAAILEGSKGFTKDLCQKYHIPTAAYGRFSETQAAKEFLRQQSLPIVVKADGLAAGKGVIIATTREEAEAAVDEILSGQFGAAGAEIVIEEFLQGEEVSFFALTDGVNILPFGTAQDHKRVGDGDVGPNTGGMGAYSPAPILSDAQAQQVMTTIIEPTVKAMAAEGRPYSGVLYAGLMLTDKGPMLLEYNCRFGDPECQVLMMRLKSDLVPVLLACANGTLDQVRVDWQEQVALTVVMAAKGYPGEVTKGEVIEGFADAAQVANVEIFHAGTRQDAIGRILSNGGRVLNICARGDNVGQTRATAYQAIERLDWPGGFYRKDIGWRALARETLNPNTRGAPMTDPDWSLPAGLSGASVPVCSLALCEVRLMREGAWPWLVLVPRVNDAVELIDLSQEQQHRLIDEIAMASNVLKAEFKPFKLNVASLGNFERKLHVHVIGRQKGDPAWPNPVWSALPAKSAPHSPEMLKSLSEKLRKAFE